MTAQVPAPVALSVALSVDQPVGQSASVAADPLASPTGASAIAPAIAPSALSAKPVLRGSQKLRALRHPAQELGVGPISVTAWHPRLQVLKGQVENLSMSGLCLRIPSAAIASGLSPAPGAETEPAGVASMAVDDWLLGVHASLATGEVVCHSDATVRHLRADGDDLLVGVQLVKGVVDLPLLFERQTRDAFAARLFEAERTADSRRILPLFKEWVSDLRNYLERMRSFLDREEAALETEDLYTHAQICSQYLAEVGPRIVERVHQASHAMPPMLGHLSDEDHAAHRAYAQHHLSHLFQVAPFIRRAQKKPLGYAGDYEMMNMLYRPSQGEGASLFAKVINLCAASEVAARANINRISFLCERIRTIVRRVRAEGGGRARLCSVGCGPAREIEVLLENEPELGPYLDVALVDQDNRAISFIERKLTPLAQQTGAKLHYIRESVRRLLTGGGSLAHTLGPRHAIYSAGLFDYLSERSFTALLGALYGAVSPGGQLLVGNVDVSNPTRYFMEYFAEWFLVHRSRAQLLEQARLLRPAPAAARVESEPLGVNLFLIVEK